MVHKPVVLLQCIFCSICSMSLSFSLLSSITTCLLYCSLSLFLNLMLFIHLRVPYYLSTVRPLVQSFIICNYFLFFFVLSPSSYLSYVVYTPLFTLSSTSLLFFIPFFLIVHTSSPFYFFILGFLHPFSVSTFSWSPFVYVYSFTLFSAFLPFLIASLMSW